MSPGLIVEQIFNGLVSGAVYALMASGLSLIWGTLKMLNFAHGEFYMLGAFVVYHLYGRLDVNFFLALAASAVTVGVLGAIVERVIFVPLRSRELSMLMSALGLQIALQGVMAVTEGVEALSLPAPVSGVYRSSWLIFPYDRLLVVAVAAVVLALFYAFITWSKFGQALRAVAQDAEAALMQGIPVNRVYTLAFAIGCALAAIAGGVIGPVFSLHVYMGQAAILKAFVVVILGGLGSVPGAVVGGLILGLAESVFASLFGVLVSDMLGFLLIMMILLWRPFGLLGRATA